MLSAAIFQPEITTLESQIAQLKTQIAQAEQRIVNLSEVESIANNAIASLQSALQEVSALAPSAITNLKSAVFDLFKSDSHQPIEVQPQPELNGQYSDFAVPLSDAPEINDPFVELVQVSNAIAYQRRHDGEIICTYAGFGSKARAKQWGEWLTVHRTVASGFEVREAKRLTNVKHELKLWGMSLTQIEQLAECDFSKDPSSQSNPFKNVPKLLIQEVAPTPTEAELEEELEAISSIQPPDSTVSIVSGYSANPIGRAGADANWKAFQASGRKLDLKSGFDSMQKWRDSEAAQNELVTVAEPDF